MKYNYKKAAFEPHAYEAPLTHADVAALAWAVRRAADNSCLLGPRGRDSQQAWVEFDKDYKSKVKAVRAALRKVRELKGQGL